MKIQRILFLALLLFCVLPVSGQILNPIKWEYSQKRLNDSTEEISFTARLENAWHLYSQFTPEGGPIPTEFGFEKVKGISLKGKVNEPKSEKKFEELFGVDVHTFKQETVVFKQIISISGEGDKVLKGTINGMTCKDEVGCIPMDETPFSFKVKGRTKSGSDPVATDTTSQAIVADTQAIAPVNLANQEGNCKDYVIEGLSTEAPAKESGGYWVIFLLGFGGGLLALFTPCVFPMIPLTVSFFTKNSQNRKKGLFLAVVYGLCIAGIYTLISVPFVVADVPPDTLSEIATSATLNIIFFVIFVAFAFSFFGYYEITMPSSLANKADSASDIGGLIGVFFMAITLAIVSFSCTGPILGSFLAGTLANTQDSYDILFVMLGFGTALGLPFALFAAFPAWLNSLPKSGGWLNSVKVVLGFLELGMAFKFASNADLVEQWGLLKRETFLAIWAILGFALSLYLLGLIRFPHDSKVKKRGPIRIALSTAFFICGVYFTAGIFGAGLDLISGFPPPTHYSYRAEWEEKNNPVAQNNDNHCPQGIPCENDFAAALERSKRENKPILIDFTGWACVNCRRMEEGVWVDPEVKKVMSEEYVLVSLYVDEKANLPENEMYTSCATGKRIKTVGNKWSNLQLVNFKSNSQPQYVLLSPQGKLLADPIGYTSRDEYFNFLLKGVGKPAKPEMASR